VIRVEVLDADVVREKHRWMEGEGAILMGQDSHAVAQLSFCHVLYASWTAVGRGPWEALNLHASLALHTPCEWKVTHTWHLGAVENKGTFYMLSRSLRRPAVSVFHLSACLVFFKGFDDFSFLGGGVEPSSAFRFSLGDPLFGVGGFAMQKATSGAKVTLMVVPNVMHSQ
jgi:hypothetical protein